MIFGFAEYSPLEYDGYKYPAWANALGWCIACSSTACIPLLAIIQIARTPGTFKQVPPHYMYVHMHTVYTTPNDVIIAAYAHSNDTMA